LLASAVVLLGWAYFPTLDWLVNKWFTDSSYSHGILVPVVSAVMVYRKRHTVQQWLGTPRPYLAALVFLAVLGMRTLAGGLLFNPMDAAAMLLSIAALALAVGGWTLIRNTWRGLVFLVFMVPLPYEWEQALGAPLKMIATNSSAYMLQTFGYPAVTEGNTILIDDVRLGVVDACSGLKMLVAFAAFAGGAVLMLNRGWFENFLIILAVVPIALITNVLRITATGVVYTLVRDPESQHVVHDVAGWLMMPLGLAFLAMELWILSRLIIKPAASRTV
jgi:exosortase